MGASHTDAGTLERVWAPESYADLHQYERYEWELLLLMHGP